MSDNDQYGRCPYCGCPCCGCCDCCCGAQTVLLRGSMGPVGPTEQVTEGKASIAIR